MRVSEAIRAESPSKGSIPRNMKIMGVSAGVSIMYGRVPLHLFSITNSATEETMLMLDMATTVEERRKRMDLKLQASQVPRYQATHPLFC